MTLREYQDWTKTTDITNGESWYYTLGLAGEAGEVAELIKKSLRPNGKLNITDLTSELGDVLWYLARLASHYGIGLEHIAMCNQVKLNERRMKDYLGQGN